MASTRVHRYISAPRAAVYRALLDAKAVQQWMAPDGMTSEVHVFESHEGGAFRISLTYDSKDEVGKSSAHTDTHHGRFVTLVPDARVVQTTEFETSNPGMRGEMTITIELKDAPSGGTYLVVTHDKLPSTLSAADNEIGWRSSLDKLATLVEPQSAKT